MELGDEREKVCGRCGHVWLSHTETPVRCPGCGTYHWQGTPKTYTCTACGHTWFSRSEHVPLRCPKCKTRSWMDTSSKDVPAPSKASDTTRSDEIVRRYMAGEGCVAITMATGIPMSTVIDVLKKGVCGGKTPKM